MRIQKLTALAVMAASVILSSCGISAQYAENASKQKFQDGAYKTVIASTSADEDSHLAMVDELKEMTKGSKLYIKTGNTDTLFIPERMSATLKFSKRDTSTVVTLMDVEDSWYTYRPWYSSYYSWGYPFYMDSFAWHSWYHYHPFGFYHPYSYFTPWSHIYTGYYDPWFMWDMAFYDPWYSPFNGYGFYSPYDYPYFSLYSGYYGGYYGYYDRVYTSGSIYKSRDNSNSVITRTAGGGSRSSAGRATVTRSSVSSGVTRVSGSATAGLAQYQN